MVVDPRGYVLAKTSKHKQNAKKRPKKGTATSGDTEAHPNAKRGPKAGSMKEPRDIVIFDVSNSPATRALATHLQQRGAAVLAHSGRKPSHDRSVYNAIVGTTNLAHVGPNVWNEIAAKDFRCSTSRASNLIRGTLS